jgi:ABC-type phosphate transport system substrate-binding protein
MSKLILVLNLFMAGGAAAAFADVVVVVNANNTATWSNDQIQSEIKDIFLGKRERFSDGTPAKPIDQGDGKSIRKDFYMKIANKDETAMNVYWSNLIFTGNGRPPKIMSDDASVKKFVTENPSGIGYIDSGSVDKTVKVIYTFK